MHLSAIWVIKGNADHDVLMVDVIAGLKIYLKVTRNRELLLSQTYSDLIVLRLWSNIYQTASEEILFTIDTNLCFCWWVLKLHRLSHVLKQN